MFKTGTGTKGARRAAKAMGGLLGLSLSMVPATGAGEAKWTSPRPYNVFVENSGVMRLSLSGGAAAGGRIAAFDVMDRPLFTQPVPAGAALVEVELPERGFYRLEATVEWAGADAAEPLGTTAAVTGDALPLDVRVNSPFGMFSVNGDNWLERGLHTGRLRAFMPINGITREQADSLLPGKNFQLPPKPLPSWWAGNTRGAFGYTAVLMVPPNWVYNEELRAKANNDNFYAPNDWEGYARALEYALITMSTPYDTLELINEPNDKWRGTEADLIKLLAEIRKVQKRVRPEVKLLAPCSYNIDLNYLERLAKLGMFDHIDGLVVHHYANTSTPEGAWFAKMVELKEWMKKWGHADMPLHITEYGWQTAEGDWAKPVTIREQALFAARGTVLMRALDVAAMNYFCLGWRGRNHPKYNGWAVTEENAAPRPSYAALANVYRTLAPCKGPGRILRPGDDIWLAAFERPDGVKVVAAWTTGAARELELPAEAQNARGLGGRPLRIGEARKLALGPDLVFFELTGGDWLEQFKAIP